MNTAQVTIKSLVNCCFLIVKYRKARGVGDLIFIMKHHSSYLKLLIAWPNTAAPCPGWSRITRQVWLCTWWTGRTACLLNTVQVALRQELSHLRADFSRTNSILHLPDFFTYNHADFLCKRRITSLNSILYSHKPAKMYTTNWHELSHAWKAWPGTLVDPCLLSGYNRYTPSPSPPHHPHPLHPPIKKSRTNPPLSRTTPTKHPAPHPPPPRPGYHEKLWHP